MKKCCLPQREEVVVNMEEEGEEFEGEHKPVAMQWLIVCRKTNAEVTQKCSRWLKKQNDFFQLLHMM